jgi:RND family efflux transporter MFP subunit
MKRFALIVYGLIVAACGHDHGSGGAQEGLEPLSITHFTEATELFVEFEPLRLGENSAFAAHVTRLSDFKPVTAGRLAVTLAGGGQADERFEVAAPAASGIFKPVVKPRAAGARRLAISLDGGDVHELGEVTVFPSAQAAVAKQGAENQDAGAIKFLKEQQWQVDFATAPAGLRPLRATVEATGTVRANANGSAQLVAPVSGQLVASSARFPHVGMKVARGEALFHIVPKLAADVDMATLRLAVEKARLHLEHEQRERARLEELLREEAIAERRVLAARHEEEVARAELDAAQKRLAPYAGGGQGNSGVVVRAPVAGTVVELALAPGVFVNEGQPLAQLADPSRLWIEARVAEADAARVSDVQGAWIRAPGLDQPLAIEVGKNARLVAFGHALDPATRTVPLIFEFQSAGAALRIGTALRVEIWNGKGGERLAVPASAIVDEGGQSVVFVQRGGESFERRVVATGVRDGNQVEIRSGLKAGERVVTRGAYLVRLAGASPKAAGEGHVH